jgi:glutamyl-tRNA synthetase/nondiscriminating glutamyl-tRNA synthetase
VRVRFAPSPTGSLHVGNARTALFNWLLARRHGGAFVLRIENTDRARSTAEAEQGILEDLRWLGLDWDEGPDVDGPYAPYRQSERAAGYQAAAEALLGRRQAYYCFCRPHELEAARRAAMAAGAPPAYDGRCRTLDAGDAERRVAAGEAAALRFAVPQATSVTFDDHVRGAVTFKTDVIGDPIILRSDGRPAYNFAVVVDDAAMKITDVLRGEDHLSNTPRQLLLYEALGLTPPRFSHLALVVGSDHAPLSKRHGTTSVADFRDRGFLPEALVNYLALLGWSPGADEEVLPLEEMVPRFDLGRVNRSPAVFDVDKLAWMNRQYLQRLTPSRIVEETLPYFEQAGFVTEATDAARQYIEALLPIAVGSVDRLLEIPERVAFVFDWDARRAADFLLAEPEGHGAVRAFAEEIANAGPLDREGFRAAVNRVKDRTGLKGRALFHPIRVTLTAAQSGPELDLAIPAIDRGAALSADAGLVTVLSCAARARKVMELVAAGRPGATGGRAG